MSDRAVTAWAERDEAAVPWRLADGEVHVYRVALAASERTVGRRLALLSGDEAARARRLRVAAKRTEFVLTRAALRRVLGAHLGAPPAALAFTAGEHGKPALAGTGHPDLRFNVSHSHGLALLAVAQGIELGVDIERIRDEVDFLRLARRFFSERERRVLEGLASREHQRAFFRCWSRKEAVIKANGRGIGLGLGAFDVTLAPHTPPRLETTRWDPAEASRWCLVELAPDPQYAAALAAGACEPVVVTWSISP